VAGVWVPLVTLANNSSPVAFTFLPNSSNTLVAFWYNSLD